MKTRNMNGQGGFTLIEVIAVLVIVGMLAAVAIPKYLDMQDSAAQGAVQGALAAGASNVTMVYSQQLVNGTFVDGTNLATTLSGAPYTNVGDFTLAYTANGNNITVNCASSAVNSINTRISNMGNNRLKIVSLQ